MTEFSGVRPEVKKKSLTREPEVEKDWVSPEGDRGEKSVCFDKFLDGLADPHMSYL